MIQSLHIFRKDVRHLWPEISVYVVLLIAFTLVSPQLWDGVAMSNTLIHTFSVLLKALIPMTWLVMIIRLVHDESLVGDQQFWVTRPYAWTSLLGAKLMFVFVCIVLPFVVMQCSLLVQAGLNPLSAIPDLLLTLVYFLLIVLLPFTVVAAVTSTLSQAFTALVLLIINWLGVMTISASRAGPRMTPPYAFPLFSTLFASLLVGILLFQYAVRNTKRSRIALVGTAVLFLGLYISFVETYFAGPADALIRHHFSSSANTSPRLALDPGPRSRDGDGVATASKLVAVNLPVHLEGMDPSGRLRDPNASFTVDIPGYHYTAPWRPITISEHGFRVQIPNDVLRRIHGTKVNLGLVFVAQRLDPGQSQTVTAAETFSVPSNGNCILVTSHPGGNLVCRYPFRSPPPTRIEGEVATQSCGSHGATHHATAITRSIPPGTRPDPVIEEPLQLGGNVCPGTQLTFTTYHPAGDFRTEIDMPNIVLDDYAVR